MAAAAAAAAAVAAAAVAVAAAARTRWARGRTRAGSAGETTRLWILGNACENGCSVVVSGI